MTVRVTANELRAALAEIQRKVFPYDPYLPMRKGDWVITKDNMREWPKESPWEYVRTLLARYDTEEDIKALETHIAQRVSAQEAPNERELDAWLAEHLFGWDAAPCEMTVAYQPCGRKALHRHDGLDIDFPPAYSTTGDGMLLVMEAMRERGYGIIVERNSSGDWLSEVYRIEPRCVGGAYDFMMPAETGPMAVAKAAKLALEAPL